MRNNLIAIGLVIAVIMTLVVQGVVVLNSTNSIILDDSWLGIENIKLVIFGGCAVFPFHFALIYSLVKKKKVEIHWAIPLAIMSYMIGVTIYGLVF